MKEAHLYLSLMPEALIASQLPPHEFGNYMAVGSQFLSRGEAIFFELKPGFHSDAFSMNLVEAKCRPHADGSPKRSVYLGTYGALASVPVEQLGALFLTTEDGRVLKLERGEYDNQSEKLLHLYQHFCPVTPRVASRSGPRAFAEALTDMSRPIAFPKIVFADLMLHGLTETPNSGEIGDLPYREIDHLRVCLQSLLDDESKPSKNVSRRLFGRIHYRTIRSGFFVGAANAFAYYPMPSREALEGEHRLWWRSAQTVAL